MKLIHGFLVLLDLMVTAHEVVQVCVVPPTRANATSTSISAVTDELPADASACQ
jgi:hypothetical protein